MDSARQRRATNACQRCRSRKVKCSGTHPCDKCQQRRQECVFEEDRKIVVSEELFRSMKRKLEEIETVGSVKKRPRPSRDSVNSVEYEELAPETREQTAEPTETRAEERFASNPLVWPRYFKHTGRPQGQRTWLFLGPTSTWSFSRRVLTIIQARVDPSNTKPIPFAVDGDAYQLQLTQAASSEPPDISGLPSLEYALYMLNTVKFHLGNLYRFFDEEEFMRQLHEFYDDAGAKANETRLWYVQFLVILAYGEAFLAPVRTTSNTNTWTKFFTRAMSLLPDITTLWRQPILAIEVLALIGLYFHSVDMRDSAYCYIGHAMRMALVEGFHRALPVDQLGEKVAERSTNIWWTVYILDRKFASLIGAPNSVNDEDITAELWNPRTSSQSDAAFSLHVKISQVITRVINTVYSADGKLGGVFLRKVRSVLHEMADLSRELEDVFSHRFQNSVDAISGVTTRLTLSCHLCIIVTVRPLVLSLLWERMNSFEDGDALRTLSSPVRTLIQACVDSSIKSLKILSALRDQNLLENFLPFDLENLFSASFILSLISVLIPDILPDPSYREMGFNLLDEMITRGSRIAQFRKSEIELLEELAQPLRQPQFSSHDENREIERSQLTTFSIDRIPEAQNQQAGLAGTPDLSAMQEEELLFGWRDFGMSLNQMLSATDELNASNNLLLDADLNADLWLWSDH